MARHVPISSLPALALVIAVAGCTSTVTGSPVNVYTAPAADGTNASQPDPGNYPAKPGVAYGSANSASVGAVVEAHRMAANVVVPTEVDPALTTPSWFNTGTVGLPDAISIDIPSPGPEIAAAHHVLLGFSSSREGGSAVDQKMLINAVLRFPDPPSAAAAATELVAKVPAPVPGHDITIPNYPAALAAAYDAQDFHAVTSFVAHGPYLLYQYAQASQGPDAAAHMVAATLDLQVPRIDTFVPTDQAHFPDLRVDASGFLNRVVPPDNSAGDVANFGDYPPGGALHFEADPKVRELYAKAGVDAVAIRRTTVYRARDAAGAQQMTDMAAADIAVRPGAKPESAVPGMPSAQCFDVGPSGPDAARARFQCFGTAGRYAFRAESADLLDVQQQMASQYLMLTA